MSSLKEAIKVFKDYYACPCCSNGKNPVELAAIYHQSSFTSRNFTCKDCNRDFFVPHEVKIVKAPVFTKRPRS